MPASRLLPSLLVACLALGGCVDPAPTSVPARQATAPAPLHDRLAGEGQRLQVTLQAQHDQPVSLGHWFSLRKDCSLDDYFRVVPLFAPAHGRVDIGRERSRPNYPVDTYRHACNDEPRDGIAASYRPAAGFTGTDTLTLRITAPSGKSWTSDFVVVVH